MPTYTWTGVANVLASNADNWSPNHTPQPGDTLTINATTVLVTGNALDGDLLELSGTTNVDIWGTGSFNIRAGWDSDYGLSSVNFKDSEWIGGLHLGAHGTIFTIGGNSHIEEPGTWYNTGSTILGQVVVGVPVIGTGYTLIEGWITPARMEFAQAVDAGQSLKVTGTMGVFGAVQADTPSQFQANVDLGDGEIILKAIAATSYALYGDLLSLYNGNTLVDTVHMVVDGRSGASAFGVVQVPGAVVIHADGPDASGRGWAGGIALPVHMA